MLHLSNELIQQIFLLLAPIDLFHCCMTCRRLYLCTTSFGLTRDLLKLGSCGYTTTDATSWTRDSFSQFLSYKKKQLLLYFNPIPEQGEALMHGIDEWEIQRGTSSDYYFSYNDGISCRSVRGERDGLRYFTIRGIQLVQLYPLTDKGWHPEPDTDSEDSDSTESSNSSSTEKEKGPQMYYITEFGWNAIGFGTSVKDNLLVVVQITDSGSIIVHLYALSQYARRWTRRVHPLAAHPMLHYILPHELKIKYISKASKASSSWMPLSKVLRAKIRFGKDLIAVDMRLIHQSSKEMDDHSNQWRELVVWNWHLGIRYPTISGMDDAYFVTPTYLLISYTYPHPFGPHIAIINIHKSTPEELHTTRLQIPLVPSMRGACVTADMHLDILFAKTSHYYENPLLRQYEDRIARRFEGRNNRLIFDPVNVHDRLPWAADPEAGICCVEIYVHDEVSAEQQGWLMVISIKYLLRLSRTTRDDGVPGMERTRTWDEWNDPSCMRCLPISFAEYGISISGSTLLCLIPGRHFLRWGEAQGVEEEWGVHVSLKAENKHDDKPGAMALFDFGDLASRSLFVGKEQYAVQDVGMLAEEGTWSLKEGYLQGEISNRLPFKAYVSWQQTNWSVIAHEASWFVYLTGGAFGPVYHVISLEDAEDLEKTGQ